MVVRCFCSIFTARNTVKLSHITLNKTKLKSTTMKHTYHTDFIFLSMLGMLGKEEVKAIPKSTLHAWKNRDFSNLIGRNISFADDKIDLIKTFLSNKSLLNAAKGLYFIHCTWVSITNNL
jgi:hypothetical protein